MVRGTYRYKTRQEPWTELRMRIREIAQSRVRYGYRKIRVLLNREGWDVGKYLVYRLYKEEGLALKRRSNRKRKAVRRREAAAMAGLCELLKAGPVWAVDSPGNRDCAQQLWAEFRPAIIWMASPFSSLLWIVLQSRW
jgi:transposase InsO family protein